jgi:hypothetical protein
VNLVWRARHPKGTMKLLYLMITVLLIASLAGLEIISSRLPDDAVTPEQLRGSTPAVTEVSGS